MFGGLTKTSSRIAIAAALGLTLGGFAFKATPAQAADLGGDCCADLEERVAELEATTVRKGNKKVSVTISGWVIKSFNWWDDGSLDGTAIGDKDYDLGSRFAITGSATIAPGWSAGYNMTVTAGGSSFGIIADQFNEYNSVNGAALFGADYGYIDTLYSYIYIKSDKWGTLNWGHLSPASDNPAVLADISGTVIESNFVGFEGAGFFLRPKGTGQSGDAGLSALIWNNFWSCNSTAAPGADCFGVAEPAIRYDSPTWGGFRFETSYGTYLVDPAFNNFFIRDTQDSNFWDIAVFYTADWNSVKISLAYAYTWLEGYGNGTNAIAVLDSADGEDIHQVGGTIMHKPSGLGVYATGNWEDASGIMPDTSMWGVKPFWRKTWMPLGATILYGEYAQYDDYFGNVAGTDLCPTFTLGGALLPVCVANADVFVTGSQMDRWGLGVVQEIDSAAMHVWLRWQHQDLDVDFVNGFGDRVNQSFDNLDIIQAGGVIFF